MNKKKKRLNSKRKRVEGRHQMLEEIDNPYYTQDDYKIDKFIEENSDTSQDVPDGLIIFEEHYFAQF